MFDIFLVVALNDGYKNARQILLSRHGDIFFFAPPFQQYIRMLTSAYSRFQ